MYFPHWWAEDQAGADGGGGDGMDYEGGIGLSGGGGDIGSRAEDEVHGLAPAADVEDLFSEDSS